MVTVITGILILLLLLFAGATFLRKTSLFFPYRYPEGAWDVAMLDPKPEDVWFEASDGVRLHGWLFHSDERPEQSEQSEQPVIIWSHGNAGNLSFRADAAAELAKAGFTTFVYDYRGFGRSAGTTSESELYLDAIAAYDRISSTTGAPIVVYGESIGGAYAAWTAANRDVCGVILESSLPSLREAARVLYSPAPIHLLTWEGLRTAEWTRASEKPALVMHARNDSVLPFSLGVRLRDLIGPRASMVVFEHSDHSTIAWDERELWLGTVSSFIRNACE